LSDIQTKASWKPSGSRAMIMLYFHRLHAISGRINNGISS
jgi:hypothetical protein